jgi:hypothetical protein
MPTAYPIGFRRDVIAVARRGEQSKEQVARSFGISASCLAAGCGSLTAKTRPPRAPARHQAVTSRSRIVSCVSEPSSWSRRTRSCAARRPTSPARPPKMVFPLVVDLAADSIPVAVTCRVLGFSKQAFSRWRADPVSQRDWDDAQPVNAAVDVHHDDPEFGYRFTTDELAGHGTTACRNRVNRLCTQRRIFSNHAGRARPQPNVGTAGPRRSGRAGVRRDHTEPVVADRHHRAPDRGRQALPVRGQGRLHQPDRRLLHGRTHGLPAGRRRPGQRRRAATPDRHGGAPRPRQPVPLPRLRPGPASRRPAGVDGPGRGLRR